jgi:hypothetical protein
VPTVIKSSPTPWIAPVVMSYVETADDLARADQQWRRLARNATWFEAHAPAIYATHRDRYVCVAGEELFVAETSDVAVAAAKAKHPDDNGRILRHIPAVKLARV